MRSRLLLLPVLTIASLLACATTADVTLEGPAATPPATCSGSSLASFTPPVDPGGGGFLFTISGEALAVAGYGFTAGTSRGADPAFVDGWSLAFDHILVSFDRITLSDSPDGDPNDQSRAGHAVAEIDGPWGYDLVHPTSRALTGKGGAPERADPIAAISAQNLNGGAAFDPTTKYAFGFESVRAEACAINVNLDADAQRLWSEMVTAGYAVYYVGTATYRGDATCTQAGGHDFSPLPRTVPFKLGFATPTAYVNCQNPDLQGPGDNAFEDNPRGVQAKPNVAVVTQLTFHTDHPFWDALTHDAPLHFDAIAAAASAGGVTIDALRGLDYNGFRLASGAPLPPRSCVPDYTPLPGGQLRYLPEGIAPLYTYYDFIRYSQSTQGHLNSDGLCSVYRRYPSPR